MRVAVAASGVVGKLASGSSHWIRSRRVCKNWGRWGPEDQAGALNYITKRTRARAARTVVDGSVVSCSRDFPVVPSPENPTPAQHHMLVAGDALGASGVAGLETALDYIGISFHGMATSHIDALCHVFVGETMYNGFPASDVKSVGALKNDIMVARDGIVTRGVLLDVPRLHVRGGTGSPVNPIAVF